MDVRITNMKELLQDFANKLKAVYVRKEDAGTVTEAEKAQKLSTKRKLWGNDFDGSADVDGAIKLGNATISYDAVNDAVHIDKPLYSDGWISAQGASPETVASLQERIARIEQQLGIS